MNGHSKFSIVWLVMLLTVGAFALGGCELQTKDQDAISLETDFTAAGYAYFDNGDDACPPNEDCRPSFAPTAAVYDTAIADVDIEVVGAGGGSHSATSGDDGYFTIGGLTAGLYTATATKDGYDSVQSDTFELDTISDFVSFNIDMAETEFTATVLGNVLRDGDGVNTSGVCDGSLLHGQNGVSAVYSKATATDLLVTLNQAAGNVSGSTFTFGSGSNAVVDGSLNSTALVATSDRMTITVTEANMNTLASQAATEIFGNYTVDIAVSRVTPIHTYQQGFDACIEIKVTD